MMTQIKKDDIAVYQRLFESIPMGNDINKGYLFFPIMKEADLAAMNGLVGVDAKPSDPLAYAYEPGLLIGRGSRSEIAYAMIRGIAKFDLKRYLVIAPDCTLKKDEIEELSQFECYLICEDNISFSRIIQSQK